MLQLIVDISQFVAIALLICMNNLNRDYIKRLDNVFANLLTVIGFKEHDKD